MPLELELFSFYNVKARKDCELLNPIPEIALRKVKDLSNEIRRTPILDIRRLCIKKIEEGIIKVERKTSIFFYFLNSTGFKMVDCFLPPSILLSEWERGGERSKKKKRCVLFLQNYV